MAKRPDWVMKSWTALNINEFILFDMFGSPCRRVEEVLLKLSEKEAASPPPGDVPEKSFSAVINSTRCCSFGWRRGASLSSIVYRTACIVHCVSYATVEVSPSRGRLGSTEREHSLLVLTAILTLSLPYLPRRHSETDQIKSAKSEIIKVPPAPPPPSPPFHYPGKGFLSKCTVLKVDLL